MCRRHEQSGSEARDGRRRSLAFAFAFAVNGACLAPRDLRTVTSEPTTDATDATDLPTDTDTDTDTDAETGATDPGGHTGVGHSAAGTTTLWVDGFETGTLAAEWVVGGAAGWFVSESMAIQGTFSARTGAVGDNQASTLSYSLDLPATGEIAFWHGGSTEPEFDTLTFLVDGVPLGRWSGTWGWEEATYVLAPGPHLFLWTYRKDGTDVNGADAAAIDEVTVRLTP